MSGATADASALFVAMPERHLVSASELDLEVVHLPLGRLGDVPAAAVGSPVYVVSLDDEGVAARAATWRAVLVAWSAPEAQDDAELDGLPPSWIAEREAPDAPSGVDADDAEPDHVHPDPEAADEDDAEEDEDDEEDDEDRARQVFLSVRELTRLERRDWIFANEVVPKQRRGSRTFVPMSPTLVRMPD